MKDGSLVIEIDHNEDLKESFLVKLENLLDDFNINYKAYRVSNGNLMASIASKPVDREHEVPLTLNVYAPFYKITKLEMPDEEKASKLLEEYLEKG